MFTVSRALEKALLQHFIYEKLAIAYAINKPFPFFESLRDKSFITEQMYSESLEAWRHLVPVSRVVYNILSKLEKTFNLSLLATMFSQTNLCEYPNLRAILRSFINVSSSDDRIPPKKDKEDAQEMSHAPSGPIPVIRDDSPEPNAPEEPQEALSTPPNKKGPAKVLDAFKNTWIIDNHSSHQKEKTKMYLVKSQKETQEENAAKRRQEPARAHSYPSAAPAWPELLPTFAEDPLSPVRAAEPGVETLQVWLPRPGSQLLHFEGSVETNGGAGRSMRNTRHENPKEEVVDFLSPTLPVTCGDAKGIFYKEKMGPRSLQKCIQNEKGAWFTPDEFVIQGKGKKSKDWKRSMHCGGKTLRQLLETWPRMPVFDCRPCASRRALRIQDEEN
ncbi:interferon-induced protein 75-like [Ctenodactylus gundi]